MSEARSTAAMLRLHSCHRPPPRPALVVILRVRYFDMTALVGIVLPFFNSAATLRRSVRSIQNQSLGEWVLYLCDDGSTDGSSDIARQLSIRDPRIHIISDGLHRGLPETLNCGISVCTERYLARMDADDIAYPERLASQVTFLEENPDVDLIGTSAVIFGAKGVLFGKRVAPADHGTIVRWPSIHFPIMHPTYCGKLSWFKRYQYRPQAVRCEDSDLLLRSYRDSTFGNLSEVLLGYSEPGIDLRKRLISRRSWCSCLHDFKGQASATAMAISLQTALAFRDVAVKLFGVESLVLANRQISLTDAEIAKWAQTWQSVAEEEA